MTTPTSNPQPQKAAFIVIGSELLSGRVHDVNIPVLATALGRHGIDLEEVRIIPDDRKRIVEAVQDARARYDQVFTGGGIGPTHDDITASSVAEAFGVPLVLDQESDRKLQALSKPGTYNAARRKMAMLPQGAKVIENSVSTAPGFSLGNVHVLAGVPSVFKAMVAWLVPRLPQGAPVRTVGWQANGIQEGDLAQALTEAQQRFPTVELGSYPLDRWGKGQANTDGAQQPTVALTAKGRDPKALEEASKALAIIIRNLAAEPLPL
ncbi:competence/damage-inducible protein A [Formicincola oecophyllae]|uniref:Competence/damage-inducible protein A n=1 Tax=Formicincola oecophyllae TaxID=2558361 RepID=A0A4Y6U9I8_9PROT|nr:molybdopterin-binding protein [Formicincola oecophyllae]QDH13874.1 competence/damage-inducible protein A [Formicincola oecophyllae]